MRIDYSKTKWSGVNRICRRHERYQAKAKIYSYLTTWVAGMDPEPHVAVTLHLENLEDIAQAVSFLEEIAGEWPAASEGE
ncbi:MAG: hypothetical protein IKP86_09100 [Anaerolineaceae bacterium]|nr:hypothetical protein [Anaerolineaceae bacterium]